jgi:hypothetical protein
MATTTELNPTTVQPIAAVPSDSGSAPLTTSPAGIFTEEGFKEGAVAPAENKALEQQERANAATAQQEREKSTICKCTIL